MKNWTKLALLCLPFLPMKLVAQGIAYPLSSDAAYNISDRLEISTGISPPFHSAQKTFSRGDVTRYALRLDTIAKGLTALDRADLQYIFDDNNEWLDRPETPTMLTGRSINADSVYQKYTVATPQYRLSKKPILKYFYRTPANLYEFDSKYFDIKVNPILSLQIAKDKNDPDQLVFQNQRGIEVRGNVDDRVYFYSQILETQQRFANYVDQRISRDDAIPGAGFYKTYTSNLFNIKNGYDFLNAQAYIGFNVTKHIGLQFGHGVLFLGDGQRSLFLSDFSNNMFFLRFNTKVWHFEYQNIFAELTADTRHGDDHLLPKKYVAMHHLSYNVRRNLNVGVFEGIVFSRNNQLELQYLNPVIFYRAVEQGLGSPDNAVIGVNAKWNVAKKFQFYGQFMLDEFVFNELILHGGNYWWANKFSGQLGVKYINAFGVDHLDAQLELNAVRPYTYSHTDSAANYTNNREPLGHPLGSNFREIIFRVKYQPLSKLTIEGRFIQTKQGESTATQNWGDNPNTSNTTHVREYGNVWYQGIMSDITLVSLDASYRLFHNGWLDFHMLARKKTSDDPTRNLSTFYVGGGFRMNIGYQRLEF